MSGKNDILLTDETPTVKKIQAIKGLIEEGTIVFETLVPQIIIVILLIGATVYLAVTDKDIPQWLTIADGLIVGFYFGSDYEYRKIKGKVQSNDND